MRRKSHFSSNASNVQAKFTIKAKEEFAQLKNLFRFFANDNWSKSARSPLARNLQSFTLYGYCNGSGILPHTWHRAGAALLTRPGVELPAASDPARSE